jgi:DNA ligase-1
VAHDNDHGLVFEVAFEGLQRSTRHKSGIAMRFPRISRLRRDKHPRDADRLETLEALLERGTRSRESDAPGERAALKLAAGDVLK